VKTAKWVLQSARRDEDQSHTTYLHVMPSARSRRLRLLGINVYLDHILILGTIEVSNMDMAYQTLEWWHTRVAGQHVRFLPSRTQDAINLDRCTEKLHGDQSNIFYTINFTPGLGSPQLNRIPILISQSHLLYGNTSSAPAMKKSFQVGREHQKFRPRRPRRTIERGRHRDVQCRPPSLRYRIHDRGEHGTR
jgi:hypothetical protein